MKKVKAVYVCYLKRKKREKREENTVDAILSSSAVCPCILLSIF